MLTNAEPVLTSHSDSLYCLHTLALGRGLGTGFSAVGLLLAVVGLFAWLLGGLLGWLLLLCFSCFFLGFSEPANKLPRLSLEPV
jgi:hypothetical protein